MKVGSVCRQCPRPVPCLEYFYTSIDVTVTSPLAASNLSDAAAKPGAALEKACVRKRRETAEACRAEGLVFIPFAMETLGGFDTIAITQVKQLASALARSKGSDEREAAS